MSCPDAGRGVNASPIAKSRFMQRNLAPAAYHFIERRAPRRQRYLFQQPGSTHAKRDGQLLDHGDCRVPPTSLNIADIGPVNVGTIGIILLAPTFLLPQAADVLGKAKTNIHADYKPRM